MCDGRRRTERQGRLDSSHWAVISPLDLSPSANERQPALCDADKPRLRSQGLPRPGKDAPAQLVSSGALGLSRGVLGKCEGQQKRDRLCWDKHSPEPSFSSGSRLQAFTGGLSFLSSPFFFFFFSLLKCLVMALEGRRLFKPDVSPLILSMLPTPQGCGCFSTFAHCSICQELRIPPSTEPTPGPPLDGGRGSRPHHPENPPIVFLTPGKPQ